MALRRVWSEFDANSQVELDDLNSSEKIHLTGVGGGVDVFPAKNGKNYTVKIGNDTWAMKDEIFADGVYRLLGFNVPKFSVYEAPYKDLPDFIKTSIQQKPHDENQTIIFRLSEFIESNKSLNDEEKRNIVKKELPHGFVTDCFLANDDLSYHWGNTIIDNQSNVWRIDNGATLRFIPNGRLKELRTQVDELSFGRMTGVISREIYGKMAPSEIQEQTASLLKNKHRIIEYFFRMHEKLVFDAAPFLLQILVNRLQYLHEHISPDLYPYAPPQSEACAGYTNAGVLLYADINGECHVLLGKRRDNGGWGVLSGDSKQDDVFLFDTASRELKRQSNGCYALNPSELVAMPSHDLLVGDTSGVDMHKTRMYFMPCAAINVQHIMANQHADIRSDYETFLWVPAKQLYEDDIKRELNLDPNFEKMLDQPEVHAHVLSLRNSGIIKNNEHTRSRVSKEFPVRNVEKDVKHADGITPLAKQYQVARSNALLGLVHAELLGVITRKGVEEQLTELDQKRKKLMSMYPIEMNVEDASDLRLRQVKRNEAVFFEGSESLNVAASIIPELIRQGDSQRIARFILGNEQFDMTKNLSVRRYEFKEQYTAPALVMFASDINLTQRIFDELMMFRDSIRAQHVAEALYAEILFPNKMRVFFKENQADEILKMLKRERYLIINDKLTNIFKSDIRLCSQLLGFLKEEQDSGASHLKELIDAIEPIASVYRKSYPELLDVIKQGDSDKLIRFLNNDRRLSPYVEQLILIPDESGVAPLAHILSSPAYDFVVQSFALSLISFNQMRMSDMSQHYLRTALHQQNWVVASIILMSTHYNMLEKEYLSLPDEELRQFSVQAEAAGQGAVVLLLSNLINADKFREYYMDMSGIDLRTSDPNVHSLLVALCGKPKEVFNEYLNDFKSSLLNAVARNDDEVSSILIKMNRPEHYSQLDSQGRNVLMVAAEQGLINYIPRLLNNIHMLPDEDSREILSQKLNGHDALSIAVRSGNIQVVKALLSVADFMDRPAAVREAAGLNRQDMIDAMEQTGVTFGNMVQLGGGYRSSVGSKDKPSELPSDKPPGKDAPKI